MSSLAAVQADSFYFPPGYDPRSHGSLSKFNGSTGSNQFEQRGIIRFEMPFDGICLECKTRISRGSRFNAKKDKDGKYLSTQIWSFTMKCSVCPNSFIIKTDPKNSTYTFASGIRKQEHDYLPDDEEGAIILTNMDSAERDHPMQRLQRDGESLRKAQSQKERMEALIDLKNNRSANDFDANAKLRNLNRSRKKRTESLYNQGERVHLSIPLVEEHYDDYVAAQSVVFQAKKRRLAESDEHVRAILESPFASEPSSHHSAGLAAIAKGGKRIPRENKT